MNKCLICESKHIWKIINWDGYSINKCTNCKLIFASPMPSDDILTQYYQGFLFNMPNDCELKHQIKERKKELRKLFSFNTQTKNQNFLDFGGGTGSSYKAACELNLKVYYHDLDEAAKVFVKKKHGLTNEFIINNINDTEIRFDYIFSDNVIEHLKNPVEYLMNMRRVLNADGQIIIKTPHGGNTESFFNPLITLTGYFSQALKFNSTLDAIKSYFIRFWHCDPPRHLFSFSKPNLNLIALKAGFTPGEIEIIYYNLPFLDYSITKIFFDFRKHHTTKSMILRLLILPFIPIELISRIIKSILLSLKILTPGGIILRLRKTSHHNV